jgi:hypothetical protein
MYSGKTSRADFPTLSASCKQRIGVVLVGPGRGEHCHSIKQSNHFIIIS